MNNLCCIVNMGVRCESCGGRWCLDCWNDGGWATHILPEGECGSERVTCVCNVTKQRVKWVKDGGCYRTTPYTLRVQ